MTLLSVSYRSIVNNVEYFYISEIFERYNYKIPISYLISILRGFRFEIVNKFENSSVIVLLYLFFKGIAQNYFEKLLILMNRDLYPLLFVVL